MQLGRVEARREAGVGLGDRAGERQQHVVADGGEALPGARDRIAGRVVHVQRRPVVDQPQAVVPAQQVGVARRAVHVEHEGVEPDDVGGQLGLWRELRRERQRAGQEVHPEVDPAAGGDQLLDLGVGLGGAQRGVELHQHELGHRQPERARHLPGDDLGGERLGPLAGAAELEHVQPVVVGLHQPGHRAALPQRGHVPGRGHRAEHAGIMAGHADEAVGAAGGAGRERADDELHALARPRLRDLRRPVAVLRRGPRGVLGLDLEVLRGRLVLRRGARQARDARRRVVQGRRGQLRRARLPGQGGRRAGDRPRGRAARPGRAHVGRAARAGRGHRGRAEGAGRRARRPRGGVHAEHPGGDRGVPRHRFDRRRVVELLAGLRRAQRRRPLPADRAEGAAGGRRLQVQRQGVRPHGDGRRDPLRGRRRAGAARLPGRLRLAGRLPRRRRARVRARAVRPPAVGALLVRHHGAAEGDRPGPGRDPHRAPQEAPPPRGPAGRRPLLLVHHHRLDDVELPGQRPAHRRRDRALRRLARVTRTWACCGTSPSRRR